MRVLLRYTVVLWGFGLLLPTGVQAQQGPAVWVTGGGVLTGLGAGSTVAAHAAAGPVVVGVRHSRVREFIAAFGPRERHQLTSVLVGRRTQTTFGYSPFTRGQVAYLVGGTRVTGDARQFDDRQPDCLFCIPELVPIDPRWGGVLEVQGTVGNRFIQVGALTSIWWTRDEPVRAGIGVVVGIGQF